MNLKSRNSVIKKIFFLFLFISLSISSNSQETKYIYDTVEIYTNVKEVLDKNKREIKNLKTKCNNLEISNTELESKNNEYSQKITPLITETINTINHLISLPTNKTSLETINSFLIIANYLSILDKEDKMSNKINKLEKFKEEFESIYAANLLLNNRYNKEKNDASIEKLENLKLIGIREIERKEVINLLEEHCKMNNKIAGLFSKVNKLTDQTEKDNQLYKGIYYKYTKDYPFLENELEKKKDNSRYKSKIKESICD